MRAGAAALEKGDALVARRHFESVVAAGVADANTYLLLASACRRLADTPGLRAAVDEVLAREPQNLHGLLMKGDSLAEEGNKRAALQFYGAAVAVASASRNLPPQVQSAVRRASDYCVRARSEMEAHLAERMKSAGFRAGRSSERFEQSIDLLTGRKELYTQQPRAYYFPGLPQVQFYSREQFPWIEAIEAATNDIQAEFEAVVARGREFEPYIQSSGDLPPGRRHQLADSPDWSAFYLYKNGHLLEANAAQCPKTMAALAHAPLPQVKYRDPMALFSVLRPGVRIAPHHGFLNTRLICHLPLIVPDGCYLRVGNDQRELQRGRVMVFDDSIKHEAHNPSGSTRVILIFDIWRPELTAEERDLVKALLEAVDSFGTGRPSDWSD